MHTSYIAGMHYGRDLLLVRIRTSSTPMYVETGAANKIYIQIIRVHTQYRCAYTTVCSATKLFFIVWF